MAELNPDPYKDGDPLGPTGRITAIFDTIVDLRAAIPELEVTNLTGDQFAIFAGPEALFNFDSTGQLRSIEGLKAFQNAVCDEERLYAEFEEVLKRNGAVVALYVGENEEKKLAVSEILKRHNARKVNYWGVWHYDALA